MLKERSDTYTILHHPESALLEVLWKGPVSSEAFKEGNLKMLEAMEHGRVAKIIIDMEKLGFSVSSEDHQWFKEYFVPRLLQSNLKAIAFIEPGVFNTLSIADILFPYFPTHINFEIFDTFEAASNWIMNPS